MEKLLQLYKTRFGEMLEYRLAINPACFDVYVPHYTIMTFAENNWPSYDTSSHYEVAKYYVVDEHTRVPEILIASKLSMDKLSAEDVEIIKQAAKDSQSLQREKWAEKEKESQEKVKAAGRRKE